jgi:hypothetical protein
MSRLLYSNLYTNLYTNPLIGVPHNYDAIEHRIRCLGHILNLTVQAFLCAQDIEQAEGASIEDINASQRFRARVKLHKSSST